jgi:hypothetical protein
MGRRAREAGNLLAAARRLSLVGSAAFWTFLGVVATFFGALGAWIMKTHKEEA